MTVPCNQKNGIRTTLEATGSFPDSTMLNIDMCSKADIEVSLIYCTVP